MSKFKLGNKVIRKAYGKEYTFTIVTATKSEEHFCIYSKEFSAAKKGHEGSTNDYGKLADDVYGHWNVSYKDIELAEPTQSVNTSHNFAIGDQVYCNVVDSMKGIVFTVVAFLDINQPILIYSDKWNRGHSGRHSNIIVGEPKNNENGHYFVTKDEIKLAKIIINEVPRKNSKGRPRGIAATIHCRSVEVARSSRPVGSKTTDYCINFRIGRGKINYSRVQSDKMC